jgi:antagonist of KipI
MQPNANIEFKEVSLEQAELELIMQEQKLQKLSLGIRFKALYA